MMKTVYDRTVDRVREGDSAEDMLNAGVLNGTGADAGRIRTRSSTTSRKGCGRITTSCHPMWCKTVMSLAASSCCSLALPLRPLRRSPRSPIGFRPATAARRWRMIAKGADVNQTQPDGTTPLHWAVYRVDRELVAALLKKGARADVVNRYGASPLAEAVRVANLETGGMLLEAGADANVANEDGQTALMLAARTGNVAVAKLLVQHGADVNRRESYRDQSAVMWAAARAMPRWWRSWCRRRRRPRRSARRPPTGTTQITSEPRVQYRPTGGLTPLLYAARAGCLGCVTADGRGRRRHGPAESRRHDADDDGARQRLSRGRALPARPRRQPAHLGLVGPHAALRRGDDARRSRQPTRDRGRRSRWRSSRRCSTPA